MHTFYYIPSLLIKIVIVLPSHKHCFPSEVGQKTERPSLKAATIAISLTAQYLENMKWRTLS